MMNRFEIDDMSVVNWPSFDLSVTLNSFSQLNSIPSIVTNIRFRNGVGNDLNYVNSSSFTRFLLLKRIEIGNDCFQNVREFVIDGLERLESVKIGERCFRIDYEKRDDGVCRITNCPNLRQLRISRGSFEYFKSFEISNLNSIQSIKFGQRCFAYADFLLKGE